jgi:CheY-like chemotaxis protein
MIIDDDDDLRSALTLIMSAHGYEVAAFGDARRALGALEGGTVPFLILLDLMMAGMSAPHSSRTRNSPIFRSWS